MSLNKYLNEIRARDPEAFEKPITEKEGILLKELVIEKFNLILPEQYIDFLKLTNSFEFDGELIYGMDLAYLAGDNGGEYGIIEYNEVYREDEMSQRFFFFGDGNMDAYVLDIDKGKYLIIDKFSHEIIEEFNTFNTMFEYKLDYLLERARKYKGEISK